MVPTRLGLLAPILGQIERMVQQSRAAGVTPTRKIPTWQFSCLPSRPLYRRPTPALWSASLAKPLSSIIPTTPVGLEVAVGINLLAKTAWITAWTSS